MLISCYVGECLVPAWVVTVVLAKHAPQAPFFSLACFSSHVIYSPTRPLLLWFLDRGDGRKGGGGGQCISEFFFCGVALARVCVLFDSILRRLPVLLILGSFVEVKPLLEVWVKTSV